MPKRTCNLNTRIDVDIADSIEEAGAEKDLTYTAAARTFLKDRTVLFRAGWKLGDESLLTLFESITRLSPEKRKGIIDSLQDYLSGNETLVAIPKRANKDNAA